MSRSAQGRVILCVAVCVGLTVGIGRAADDVAKPSGVFGSIAQLDLAAKTFTVRTREGVETVVRFDEKTSIEAVRPATVNDLPDGCHVKVDGKVAEDQTQISAAAIERLSPQARGWEEIRPQEFLVAGTLSRKDDGTLAVMVKGQAVAIKMKETTRYVQRLTAKPEDLEMDAKVWASVLPALPGQARLALRVVVTLY